MFSISPSEQYITRIDNEAMRQILQNTHFWLQTLYRAVASLNHHCKKVRKCTHSITHCVLQCVYGCELFCVLRTLTRIIYMTPHYYHRQVCSYRGQVLLQIRYQRLAVGDEVPLHFPYQFHGNRQSIGWMRTYLLTMRGNINPNSKGKLNEARGVA